MPQFICGFQLFRHVILTGTSQHTHIVQQNPARFLRRGAALRLIIPVGNICFFAVISLREAPQDFFVSLFCFFSSVFSTVISIHPILMCGWKKVFVVVNGVFLRMSCGVGWVMHRFTRALHKIGPDSHWKRRTSDCSSIKSPAVLCRVAPRQFSLVCPVWQRCQRLVAGRTVLGPSPNTPVYAPPYKS